MKKLSKIFALVLTATLLLSLLAACGPTINVDGPGAGKNTNHNI